jgi:hypothetical protein
MYKEYASPNFKFWLLTKFMHYTLTYNYKVKKIFKKKKKKKTLTNLSGELNLNSWNNRTIHYNTSCLPKKKTNAKPPQSPRTKIPKKYQKLDAT